MTATPPIRVMAVIKSLGPGGAERLLVEFARCARDVGIDLRVFTLLDQKRQLIGEIEQAGVPVRCIGVHGLSEFRWMRELIAEVREHRPEVIHLHSPALAPFVRIASRWRFVGSPRPVLVTTEHNLWTSYRPTTRLADRLTASFDDLTVTVSEEVRASLPSRRRRNRAIVLHHGIDRARVREATARRTDTRRSLGLDDDEIVVVTVANYRTQKNYPNLLQAASLACAESQRLRFVTVGQGPLQHDIEAEHRRLGLGDRMMLLGLRTDVPDVLAAGDLFALSSDYEGLPVALMEAMTLGLPVVATSVGGMVGVVGPGCGRLVPPRDSAALARAILDVAQDQGLRRELGAGAQRESERFDASVTANRLSELYAEALARHLRRRPARSTA